jgi:hypothetical protein
MKDAGPGRRPGKNISNKLNITAETDTRKPVALPQAAIKILRLSKKPLFLLAWMLRFYITPL